MRINPSDIPAYQRPKSKPARERLTPQSLDAEQATLGAMLLEREAIARVFETLEQDDFYRELHQKIYPVMCALYMAEEPVDLITVVEALRKRGQLEECGGAAYLTALIEACPSAANVESYAKAVRSTSMARQLLAAAEKAKAAAYETDDPLHEILTAQAEYDALLSKASLGGPVTVSTDEDAEAVLGSIEWLWQDWVLKGFITTVVGPQEAGKSMVCLDLCRRLLQGLPWPDGHPTGIAPVDANGQGLRLLWIDTDAALGGLLDRLHKWGMPRGRFLLPKDPLRVLRFDKPADWKWVESVVAQYRPPLMVIDALSGSHSAREKDNDEMKEVMLRLHSLAQREKIAVLAIHHLRKASEMEPDWPITLDRIRGATAITQYSRSIIGVAKMDKLDQSPAAVRRMDSIKNNWGTKASSLGYAITDAGPAWGKAPEPPRPQREIDLARDLILEFLGDGEMRPADDVHAYGEGYDVARRTMQLAATKLKDSGVIRGLKEGGGRWFLQLAKRPAEALESGSGSVL